MYLRDTSEECLCAQLKRTTQLPFFSFITLQRLHNEAEKGGGAGKAVREWFTTQTSRTALVEIVTIFIAPLNILAPLPCRTLVGKHPKGKLRDGWRKFVQLFTYMGILQTLDVWCYERRKVHVLLRCASIDAWKFSNLEFIDSYMIWKSQCTFANVDINICLKSMK